MLFDIKFRTNDGCVTMGTHIYDHHMRALCIVWTCELRSEDTKNQATAWCLMNKILAENGVQDSDIRSFRANNDEVGWKVVREIFWMVWFVRRRRGHMLFTGTIIGVSHKKWNSSKKVGQAQAVVVRAKGIYKKRKLQYGVSRMPSML